MHVFVVCGYAYLRVYACVVSTYVCVYMCVYGTLNKCVDEY